MFDVLGTLVDEPAGIRAGIRALDPSLDEPRIEQLLALWQQHIEREQRRILDGARPYLTSDALDLEAARLVADAAGVDDPAAVAALARSVRRLPPWPDTVTGLALVAAHAWDLRAAQHHGLRTACIARPVGDPPTPSDRFDLHAADLPDLADQLGNA